MQICCHFRSRQPGWERCRNRLPRRGSHIPLPRARPFRRDPRPFRRDLSVHDKAGKRAFRRTLSAPKGHSSPFRHLCVQGTAAPAPPPCTLAKCAAPYGWRTAHLLSVLPPHNTCPPRKAKAPVSAISPFPHKSYSAASPQFSPSRKCASARKFSPSRNAPHPANAPYPANAPPPVNATKPPRHCAHSGKMPESSLFRATKGKFAGIHCARGGEMRESGPCRAAKGKSAGIHCARGGKTPESSPCRAAKGIFAGVHRVHGGKTPESGPCRAAKGIFAGIHCARGRKTPKSSLFRAAKGKSAGVHSARGNRNRPPQQANTQPQKCENNKTIRPPEKVFPFHGVGFRENVPCLRCTKSNA